MSATGAAVLVLTRDGETFALASARDAVRELEAVDVLDGEYVEALRVDGARLRFVVSRGAVVLEPTGERDPAALARVVRGAVADYDLAAPASDAAAVADELLRREADARWPRRLWSRRGTRAGGR